MLNIYEPIPDTGVSEYDLLMKGTDTYSRWVEHISSEYNVQLIKEMDILDRNVRADYDPVAGVLEINTRYFTYLDLLHETLHLEQLKRAFAQQIDVTKLKPRYSGLIYAWWEQGAYEFERNCSSRLIEQGKAGFSQRYLDYIERTLYHPGFGIWNKSTQLRAANSPTVRELMAQLWQGSNWEGLKW